MELHELISVAATNEPEVYIASVDLTDMLGERYTADYVSRPGDNFGLAPQVREAILDWIIAGSPVTPYEVPPISSSQVDTERDRRIVDTFQFEGVAYQMDKGSQQDIIAKGAQAKFAIQAGAVEGDLFWADPDLPFGWIATDNSVVPMDAYKMAALADAADRWVTAHKLMARQIKDMNPIPSLFTADSYWP